MKYNKKRSERQADLLEEEIPQSVQEAHLEFVIAMMQSVYDSEGLQGLMANAWTDILVTYANKKGMDVTKDLLHEQIEAEEEGTFFSKLRDTIMEMRTGITADRKITAMARLDGHGYVV